jgi:tetratricopeptide (TPR) repeat protein
MDQPQKAVETAEEIIRRFPHSPIWFVAHGYILQRHLENQSYDEYIELLESMQRRVGREHVLPLRLGHSVASVLPNNAWYADYRNRGAYLHSPETSRFWYGYGSIYTNMEPWAFPGWSMDMVRVADTPERARSILKILDPTYEYHEDELPVDWQYARIKLLEMAGMEEKARSLFEEYIEAWGEDTRGFGLRQMAYEEAKRNKDVERMEEILGELKKTHAGWSRLTGPLKDRLQRLMAEGNVEEFLEDADYCIEHYPQTAGRSAGEKIMQWAVTQGSNAPQPIRERAIAMVEAIPDSKDHDTQMQNLRDKMTLYSALGMTEKAKPLVEKLLQEQYWAGSATTGQVFHRYVMGDPVLAEIVREGLKAYGVEPIDPESPVVKRIEELRRRIKDNQLRHISEIGEEIFTKHPRDPAAPQAASILMAFYYSKAMHNERDLWYQRMIDTWPKHPETYDIMLVQLRAMEALRQREKQLEIIRLVRDRFPGVGLRWHYRALLNEITDPKEKVKFLKGIFGDAFEEGDPEAVRAIGSAEVGLFPPGDLKKAGDYWMRLAEKFKGMPVEKDCLKNALNAYVWNGVGLAYRGIIEYKDIRYSDGQRVLERLEPLITDPELKQAFVFAPVALSIHEKNAPEVDSGLRKTLKGTTKYRDLDRQVNLEALGGVFADARHYKDGMALIEFLRDKCWTRRDLEALDRAEAKLCGGVERIKEAHRIYIRMVEKELYPARAYEDFIHGGGPAYPRVAADYVKRLDGAQDLLPGLLWKIGQHLRNQRKSSYKSFFARLRREYPDSSPRGEMEEYLDPRLKEQER